MSVNIESKISDSDNSYSDIYLEQYWPKDPTSAVGWADNVLLMLAYQEAALILSRFFEEKKFRLLDLSTGPALAPILAMHSCISEVQLSDFFESNRLSLVSKPIDYWRNYALMLIKLHEHPENKINDILDDLSKLRAQNPVVEIDLFKDKPLPSNINPKSYDVISMHFVADGITKSASEYFDCMIKITDMIRPNGGFIMSAIVDCDTWQLGPYQQPSPNVSEKEIVDFLKKQGIEINYLTRSIRHPGLTFNGGWIVLSGVKRL